MLYFYNCEPVRYLDGDTVELDVDLGMRIWIRLICRLYGINAPEMDTPAGPMVLERLTTFHISQCRTYRDRRDKYGRMLVELFDGGRNINRVLFDEGLVAKYPKKAVFTPDLIP